MLKKIILPIFLFSLQSQAIEIKEMEAPDKLPKTLNLADRKDVRSLPSLSQMKWYQKKSEWEKCLETGRKELSETQLGVWVHHTYLSCLRSSYKNKRKRSSSQLVTDWQVFAEKGGVAQLFQSSFSGHRDLLMNTFLEVAFLNTDIDQARFDALLRTGSSLTDWFNEEQRGKYYRILADVAWERGKLEVARSNYLRSYTLDPSRQVLARLKELKVEQTLKPDKYSMEFIASEKEEKSWQQWKKFYDRGETLKIAVLGAEFLKNYPGSAYTDKVQAGVSRYFKKVLYLRGEKYSSLKADIEKALTQAPLASLLTWTNEAYQRGYQDVSYRLAKSAVTSSSASPEALLFAGRSGYYLGERNEAKSYFNEILEKYSGDESAAEARYLLGLLHYREGEFDDVVRVYEEFLHSSGSDRWELQVRYWLWRALKKMNSKRADVIAKSILKDFPLTYYGLLVRMEEKKNLQSLWAEKPETDLSFKTWWHVHLEERYKRIQVLISLGWIDEAELEILYLPDPQSARAYLFRAQLWQSAGIYNRAIQDYSSAVHAEEQFMSSQVLKESFPMLYDNYVEKAAKEFGVKRNLIWAIMRQESAFMPNAISPSRAYGLMQMLAPTARETARWLRVKNFNAQKDIFDPALNIRFGSHFLSRMIGKYQGVIPLAVASYNVGPGNLDRWLSHRTDLNDWPQIGKSLDDDIWIDELPWAETSFYVKAVMRNFLLYQVIHENLETLPTPPWADTQESAQTAKSDSVSL